MNDDKAVIALMCGGYIGFMAGVALAFGVGGFLIVAGISAALVGLVIEHG